MPAAQPGAGQATITAVVLRKELVLPGLDGTSRDGTTPLLPVGFLLHPLTQGLPATSELWSGMGWRAGLHPEAAKMMWLLMVLAQGCPERVKRRAPPSQYMSPPG